MALLHIHFQDGFHDDPVLVQVSGWDVAQKEHVTTRTQLVLASSVETDDQSLTADSYLTNAL